MEIRIYKDAQTVDRAAAWSILKQMLAAPSGVLGLSTGRTTGPVHALVSAVFKACPFDISGITFFGQDEVAGVDETYAGACIAMLKNEIIDDLGVSGDNFLMLPTRSSDFAADCARFSEELARRGGISYIMLGIGENGHLGFNQPGTPFTSRCRLSSMDPVLEARIRRETNTPDDVRLGGVTLGLADIMDADRTVLVAKGANKAEIVAAALKGEVSENVPASILRDHPDCTVLLDEAAASKL